MIESKECREITSAERTHKMLAEAQFILFPRVRLSRRFRRELQPEIFV